LTPHRYGPGRINQDWLVLHTPGEEVAFFSIQTLIVGAVWYLRFACGSTDPATLLAVPRLLPTNDQAFLLRARRLGYLAISALFASGMLLLTGGLGEAGTYAGLILVWCSPVMMVQVRNNTHQRMPRPCDVHLSCWFGNCKPKALICTA